MNRKNDVHARSYDVSKNKTKKQKQKKKTPPIIQLSYKKLKYFVLILNDNATSRTVLPVKNTWKL